MARVDVAVAYYWNSPSDEGRDIVRTTTELGLTLLRMVPSVGDVVLVDGSPEDDSTLGDACARRHVRYLHAGRELGLAESYNMGWRTTSSPYVCLMANDILPFPLESIGRLLEVMEAPDVGCVFPYLSDGLLYTQHADFSEVRSGRTCEPASMTLNLNVFRRSVLEAVGGVDERFAVGHYDPLLLMDIRRHGYRVVMVGGAKAIHFDQLTKRLGGSTLTPDAYAADRERWFAEYPRYAAQGGIGNLLFWRWPCATTLPAMVLWWASHQIPIYGLRTRALQLAMLLEPWLTPYPARYGRRRPFLAR